MHNDLQVNQPALIINVENHAEYGDYIGRSVIVRELLSIEESQRYFQFNLDVEVMEMYAVIYVENLEGAIRQRYLMPIPPLDDQSKIESKLILTPWELAS